MTMMKARIHCNGYSVLVKARHSLVLELASMLADFMYIEYMNY